MSTKTEKNETVSETVEAPAFRVFEERTENPVRKIIFVRGPQGAGKSWLAKQIIRKEDGHHDHVCTADDYFVRGGIYNFDERLIRPSETYARGYCEAWLRIGVRTIVIDCPSLVSKHMSPWIYAARQHGYVWMQAIPEPTKDQYVLDGNVRKWDLDALQKNCHPSVPRAVIERQISEWEEVPEMLFYPVLDIYKSATEHSNLLRR